jgi:Fe-S cluster assembly protein SufD
MEHPLALPTPALESWKFSHLARAVALVQPTASIPYTPTLAPETLSLLESTLPIVSGPQIVLWQGQIITALSQLESLPAGVSVITQPAQTPAPARDTLDELPTHPQLYLTINGTISPHLHIIQIGGQHAHTSQFQLVLTPHAQATVIEHHLQWPTQQNWHHLNVALSLAEHSHLHHAVVSYVNGGNILTRRQQAHLAPYAHYNGQGAHFTHGDQAWLRAELHATLSHHTSYSYVGLAAPRQNHHVDVTTTTHMLGEHNTINLRQRNVIDGDGQSGGHAVFQGKFHVDPEAQKTNAYMHCHNLLLHDGAKASHKPELEIYADDVKCSHGAATGGLNPMQLFYLQARGLSAHAARALLVGGFMHEFTPQFPSSITANLTKHIQQWLNGEPFSINAKSSTPTNPEVSPDDMATFLGAWLNETKS